MDFAYLSPEHGLEFRDHVDAREPFFLRELAGWVDATGGPLGLMDASAESLVEIWTWFIGFVDAGCPGVPADERPAEAPHFEPNEPLRVSAVAERLQHYVRLVVARYDPRPRGRSCNPRRAAHRTSMRTTRASSARTGRCRTSSS